MHYRITQEQELLQQTIREFAQSEIAPLASEIDSAGKVPEDLLKMMSGQGLYGLTVPQNYGGVGSDFLSLVLVAEELSKVSGSLGAHISLHNAVLCESLLSQFSRPILKERLLPKLASGKVGAFSAFDQDSTISCKLDGGFVVINGSSEYVMNAGYAEIFLLIAKAGDQGGKAIICFSKEELAKDSGFNVEDSDKKFLGMRGLGTRRISFKNMKLPSESLVVELGKSEAMIEQLFSRSRLAVAAQALGIGQASLDAAVRFANERSQFNTKIGKFYAVRDFIAMDEISIETARQVAYSCASELSASQTLLRDSCIAKVSASNAAVQAARHSIRVHGGYGFMRDYPVERYLRDARITQLYIEPNEILKSKIAGSLLES